MGRAMLFLVTGSFIVFGLVQMGVFDRQSSMNEANVQAALSAQARNVANSGMERAINLLVQNPNLRTQPGSPSRYTIGDEYADVLILDHTMEGISLPANVVEIRSTGNSGGNSATAVARIEVESGIPELNGTMGIFTNNLDFNVSGSAFLISGDDKNPDGTDGPAGSMPAMAVNSMAAFDEILGSLNSIQRTRLQGSDGSNAIFDDRGLVGIRPSLEYNDNMDGNALEEFVAKAMANADAIYDDYEASGEGSLGTPDDPKVIIVNGTLSVRNATGAGIIVIREGGALDARGNFDNFQGLIVVQGRADMTRGNIHILGGMLFGGVNPSIEIDIDFRGNVNIQYSSAALANLTTRLPQTAGTRQRLVAIYD